jgi:uncharacterized protein YkwD
MTLSPASQSGDTTSSPRRRPVLAVVLGLVIALLFPLVVNTASAQASTSTERSIAAAVTRLLNSERHAHHLRALGTNVHLVSSARSHNLAMARTNTMAHQVRGEATLGRRMDRAGYRWSWSGENIGYNSQMTKAGVLMLQKAMYNERAPYNGHRLNILSRHFRHVGVDVYLDRRHHKVWLTTDFGNK